ARLAECLLPLMAGGTEAAVERATAVIDGFSAQFDAHMLRLMRAKLGLFSADEGDTRLVRELLQAMHGARADFTLTFRALAKAVGDDGLPSREAAVDAAIAGAGGVSAAQSPGSAGGDAMAKWLDRWRARLAAEPAAPARRAAMR